MYFSYWSLAAGFLTGKYRTEEDLGKSQRGEGVRKYLNDQGLEVLKALDQVSEKHQTTQGTTALAWLLANPLITAPIVMPQVHLSWILYSKLHNLF
nr:aldo/keto reductase [Chryseobacterium carnipullorum]